MASVDLSLHQCGHRPPLPELVLGTRGSELALTQARMAEAALRERCALQVKIQIIHARGDEGSVIPSEVERSRGATFKTTSTGYRGSARDDREGRKGLFTAELERALLENRIDVAVHSAKDLPSQTNGALVIAAVLPRGPVEDLLITKRPELSSFGTIATGSVRRQRQTRWSTHPRDIVSLRGNVATRLRKFGASDWDAIILARAGMERLGFSAPKFQFEGKTLFAHVLPIAQFVPAGGQGVIALQTRAEEATKFAAVDHAETHLCLRAEREFLRLLQGDCDLPVGAHARYLGGEIELRAQLFDDGDQPRMASLRGTDPEKLARDVFEKIEHDCEHEHD